MRRKLAVFLIITVCFLLQSTLFQMLSIASISPNLLIVVTSSFGFMRGRKEGMWIGFFSGLILALSYCLVGVIWCITIIGIPFGKQCFKLAGLAITPFGATFGEKVKAE